MMPSDMLRRVNWPVLLLAFVMALGMWYTVTVRDRLEAQLDIRLDYRGIPENLVVTDGLINKVVVRLRGPEALVRAINPQSLIQVVNLSTLKKGTNIIPLAPEEWKPAFRAFEIVEVTPPRLTLQADSLMERSLAVEPSLKSPLNKSALTVDDVQVDPSHVLVRGPEGTISAMRTVPLTIPVDPSAGPGTHTQNLPLDVPAQVTAMPATVRASYSITSGRTQIQMERLIHVITQDRRAFEVSPSSVTLYVELPEALAKNSAYMDKARLSVTPPPLEPGSSAPAPLRADLPEGMTLLQPLPAEVTVTRIKK